MAFLGSFLQYLIIMLILAVLMVLGIVIGKKMRENKDKKNAALLATEADAKVTDETEDK